MAAPAFAAAGAQNVTGTTAQNVPVPAGVAAGDVILVFIYNDAASVTVSGVPPGFTQILSPTTSATPNLISWDVYWKRATGADSGTYNFTLGSTPTYNAGMACRYTGCILSGSPIEVVTAVGNGSASANFVATSLVTNGNDRLIVWSGLFRDSAGTPTQPSGFTLDSASAGTGECHASKAQAAAGSTGSLTASITTGTDSKVSWVAALLPPSAETQTYRQLLIPNRYVGPMALRNQFRRAQPQNTGPVQLSGFTVGPAGLPYVFPYTFGALTGVVTVGLTAAGTVEVGKPAPPLRIPNRSVGPMALRNQFRQVLQQASFVISGDFTGSATSTDVTVGLTATGVVGTTSASTATAVTVGLTAVGVVGTTSASTTTAVTVGLTAAGVAGTTSGSTATAVTVGLTAAGVVGTVGSASTAVTIGFTAAGVVAISSASTSTDVTVGLDASGSVDELHPAPPLIIPNRYVGPQALRAQFRRATSWTGSGFENLNVPSTDLGITVGVTADGVVGVVGDVSTAVTVGLTAAGAVGLSQTSTSTAVTVGLTAAGAVGVSQASTLTAVTVGLTAAGAVGVIGSATTAVTVGLTAAGVVGTATAASTALTVGLTADGVVGLFSSADTATTVGFIADGVNPANIEPSAQNPLRIPNRNVGPMALRQAFRRADLWLSQLIALVSDAQSVDVTVGLTSAGTIGVGQTSTTTAVSVGLTAAGVVGVVGQATTTAVTVGFTAVGGGNATGQADTAITVGLTAAGVVGKFSTATTSVTVGLTAAGAVGVAGQATTAVTVGLTAAGAVGVNQTSTATAVTVGLTAAGAVGVSQTSTATAVTAGLTAAGVVGKASTTTTSVTVGLTAAGVVGTLSATTTSVTVGLTATGFVGVASTTTTAVTINLTANGFITSDQLASGATTAIIVDLTASGAIQIFTLPEYTVGALATTRNSIADASARALTADGATRETHQ